MYFTKFRHIQKNVIQKSVIKPGVSTKSRDISRRIRRPVEESFSKFERDEPIIIGNALGIKPISILPAINQKIV